MVDFNELDNLYDDIDVASPEEYVDSNANDTLPEGTYTFVVKEFDINRDKEQKPHKTPGINLRRIDVVEGEKAGKPVFFQRIWATPYKREGVIVSQLGDFIRALHGPVEWAGMKDALALVQKAKDQGITFKAKGIWEAYDGDYFESQGGNLLNPKSEEAKLLRKKSTVRYAKNFRKAPSGKVLPEVVGPSGKTLPARFVINNFIPKK